MRLNNYIHNNPNNQQTNFKGKGINLVHKWQHDNSIRLKYYQEIANDLAEGSKLFFNKHKEIDDSVINFHNFGSLTVYFDIPDSKILKVSLENPLEFREHNPEFDIPFLSPIEKYGKTYVVVQPKADTENITKEDCINVIRRIYRNFCEISRDGNKLEQYGLFNGKAYLIDTRCAMPLPNTYTIIIDKLCKKLNKCYTFITKEQSKKEQEEAYKIKGYFSYHCDEIPRKSLTFTEGIKKIYRVLRNNIMYRKNGYCIPYEEYRSKTGLSEFVKL